MAIAIILRRNGLQLSNIMWYIAILLFGWILQSLLGPSGIIIIRGHFSLLFRDLDINICYRITNQERFNKRNFPLGEGRRN